MNLDRHDDTLDRLWAATRPEEPSAEAFDRLWAEVSRRTSRPETLPFARVPSWRRWGLALAVSAQAAALLIAGFAALKRPDAPSLARNDPPSTIATDPKVAESVKIPSRPVHDFRLALGMTFFVNLDRTGEVKDVKVRPQTPQSSIDVVTAETEVLNFMESYE